MSRHTTQAEQYKRLRAYLSPAFAGPNTDAILNALAGSIAVPLVELLEQINDQFYIITASGTYLDDKLAEYGVVRPPVIGLSDELFRELGIDIINKKQIRSLILNVLAIIFGDDTTNANANASNYEPYALQNNDTLLIAFDGGLPLTVTFTSGQFTNIATATAEEVSDAITKSLRSQGKTGSAYLSNDGVGNFVVIQSDTKGPSSQVQVFGGRAQNALKFPLQRSSTAMIGTGWTVEPTVDGGAKYTWVLGPAPDLSHVRIGDYVNIFDPVFDLTVPTGSDHTNQGVFIINEVVPSTLAGDAYFVVTNFISQTVDSTTSPTAAVQTSNDSVLFYKPVKETLDTKFRFASVYQSQANLLEIIMPATSAIIRRDRIGAMYIHDGSGQPASTSYDNVTFTADNIGIIGNSISLVFDGTTNANTVVAAWNGANPTNTVNAIGPITETLIAGTAFLVGGEDPDEGLLALGPYTYDPLQNFTLLHEGTSLELPVDSTTGQLLFVENTTGFPDAQGYVMIDFGTKSQEGPIPYLNIPSSESILLSPAYTIQKTHAVGADVSLVLKQNVIPATDGSDYQGFITTVAAGRVYATDIIEQIVAAGLNIAITIVYPSDIGLGKNTKEFVWGETGTDPGDVA